MAPNACSSNWSFEEPPPMCSLIGTPLGRSSRRDLAPPPTRTATGRVGLGSSTSTSRAPPLIDAPPSRSPRRSAWTSTAPLDGQLPRNRRLERHLREASAPHRRHRRPLIPHGHRATLHRYPGRRPLESGAQQVPQTWIDPGRPKRTPSRPLGMAPRATATSRPPSPTSTRDLPWSVVVMSRSLPRAFRT